MFAKNEQLGQNIFVRRYFEYLSILLLCTAGILLIGLQIQIFGWILFAFGVACLLLCRKHFAKDLLLIYVSIGILGLTKITTDVSYSHMLDMGVKLALAVALPYLISRYIYKDYLVRFKFHH